MSAVLLTPSSRQWECPNCPVTDVTPASVTNRYHECRGLAGITAPMVPTGSRSRVRAVEIEDYEGSHSIPQRDGNGRPIAAIYTDRPDGSNDCVVLAPTAVMKMEVG